MDTFSQRILLSQLTQLSQPFDVRVIKNAFKTLKNIFEEKILID